MPRFADQVVLLSGAASGIGRAATLKFAAEGANLLVTDVVAEGLEETVKAAGEAAAASGGRIESRLADVADEAQANESIAACVEVYGKLDTLCNNAGVIGYSETHTLSFAAWRRILGV
ncbi:MAG: SDR family NAD(P)-dependent oxidoreductase, partial [Myxococcota bacterium]